MSEYSAETLGQNKYRVTISPKGDFLIPIEGGTFNINGLFYVVVKVEPVEAFVYDVTVRL